MRKFLTGKQRAVFNFIRQRIYEGLPPSCSEIASHFGFLPKAGWDYLNVLEKKGYITRSPNKARTIELLPPYKDDTRYSVVSDKDLPELDIQKGDYLLLDTSQPASKGDVCLSTQGEIKCFAAGDIVFGKVVSFAREIG